jgi:preprotein translocase subunit SecG
MGFSVFLILITIVCFLLILAIMVQNPKGGGLSSTFGSSQQMGGVQKTTDFLDKSTWTLGGILIALILLSTLAFNNTPNGGSKILGNDEQTSVSTTTIAPTPEATQPATETAPATTEEAAK